MKLSKSVAELQREHVVMELECIDRMYLNAYVPQLTTEAGVAGFVRGYLGHHFASTKQVAEMTDTFVASIMQFALDHGIDLVRFKEGERKDDVMQARLGAFKLQGCSSTHCPTTRSTGTGSAKSSAVALRKSFGTGIAIAVLRPHQMGRVFRRKPGNEYLLAKCWKCL